jgi:hypothetical protein
VFRAVGAARPLTASQADRILPASVIMAGKKDPTEDPNRSKKRSSFFHDTLQGLIDSVPDEDQWTDFRIMRKHKMEKFDGKLPKKAR